MLHPAERRSRVGDDALVKADHADLEFIDDAEHSVEVAGVDVGDKSVLGGVGCSQRALLRVECGDRGYRSEDLRVTYPGGRVDVGENGGAVEVSFRVGRVATGEDSR